MIHSIRFLPDNVSIDVETGESILTAAADGI
ncbi:hypothetical protein HNQ81_001733 [Desulfoprunum benzoelyticum]|uniref:Ferredoxin n=1 Tax=Desulfoprunum benzoelyticum TaxID=1506996 RepID=A0A840UQD9_9BACT|nr:hypothetical protein [Desulfoprunum benzoelyticum]